ncbi:superoxide dismutase family protein [Sabulilitoribacter multivorans]|uniref:Superoxide dismutase [Cu-Zn] n=1 Tax=Flaviramulus multivorans TaxID=1304750 RepID=A0ABS9IL39_9FLAO|nr:superoxide dismutase family protein [Flaviramulus multivorans]MCF7561321.1 superoxide dismutase family protein [Flaviramulus multivorans]
MKKISLLLLALALSVVACKQNKKDTEVVENEIIEVETNISKTLTVGLSPKSDSNVSGSVVFTEENGTVNMVASITGAEPGVHAIHIHASSDCSSPDGTSTGGHWNPTAQPHGKWGAETGYHKGDIGNFTADENGNATVEFSTDAWCIGCDDDTKNIIGKGIIVHAGVDDFTTQPTGDAGGRVSCAGIIE